MLDPFTAIGLAGAIVQFVDFSSKLISSANEIHNSSTGSPSYHIYLEGVGTRLQELSRGLEQPKLTPTGKYEKSLHDLRQECLQDTATLFELIKGLGANEHRHRAESFRKAFKLHWKKEEVERLEKRLKEHRSEIATLLVALLSDQSSTVLSILNMMVEENRRIDIQRTDQLLALSARIDEIGKSEVEVRNSDFNKLQESLSNLAHTGQEILIEQTILKSLRFRGIKERHEQIPKAYTRTLEWVLQHSGPDQPTKFTEWRGDSSQYYPPFWVGGKPGSGKSTLMKFICKHPQTTAALQKWAGSDQLVIASFFFWFYGTKMQKSQEGFLQTLLHEILRKCPNLIQTSLPHRWTSGTQDPWTRSELVEAFEIFNQCLITPTKFCFFIDGLDEFDGEPRDLLPVIRDLSKSPNIELCVSSRPWQILRDEFDKGPDQRLYLQELTRNDIHAYVRHNFEDDTNFQQAKEEDAGYEDLVNEIVERAQGVWLWVALVTKSLLNGFTYGDSLKDLKRRLQHLPVDLEEFFQHMLDSVEPVYQTQMAQTFLVALVANDDLPLIVYSFLDDIREDSNFALRLGEQSSNNNGEISTASVPFNDISKREVQMQKRLDARTKGLLEISKRGTGDTRLCNRVDFLHRTVGEFLNSEAHSVFELCVQHDLSISVKHRLEQNSTLISSQQWHRPLLSHAALPVPRASEHCSSDHTTMIRLLLEHGEAPNAADGDSTTWRKFVQNMIDRPSNAKWNLMGLLLSKGADPSAGSVLLKTLTIVSSSPSKPYQIAMLDKLIEHGANPNSKYDDSTVWKRYLSHLLRGKSGLRDRHSSLLETDFKLVKQLLLSGADPDVTASGKKVEEIVQWTFGASMRLSFWKFLAKCVFVQVVDFLAVYGK